MKFFNRVIYVYYIQVSIIVFDSLVCIYLAFQHNYFFIFLTLIVFYLIYSLEKNNTPLYKICKRLLFLEKKVKNFHKENKKISLEEMKKLLLELDTLKQEFFNLINKK